MSDALDKMLAGLNPQQRKRAQDPEKRSRYSIKSDRWDRKEFDRILKQQPEISAARHKLAENIAGELGYDEGADVFWMLWKTRPDLLPDGDIRPTRLLNKKVNQEVEKLPQYDSVRRWTVGDSIGAALAFEQMEPEIETLYDRLHEQQKKQEEYEQALREALQARADAQTAEEIMQQWIDSNEGPEGDEPAPPEEMQEALAEAQAAADDAEAQAGEALADLQASLDAATPDIRSAMGRAMGSANDYLETVNDMSQSWGSEPGDLMRLPAEKRLELAKKLNTPKFKRMARLFGPAVRDAFAEQKRKVVYTPEEIFDMATGDDLPRVIPSEIAKLDMEETEILFLKDFVEKNLVQYDMRGFEKLARGGIIYCHDGSGSMEGEREVWAKAIGLALLHVSRRQKRSFYGIQFGSASEIRIDDFRDTRNLTPERVIDFAEYFFNGGTDFMTPLRHALEILRREHAEFGAVQADIVFATDGQAPISAKFMEDFKAEQRRLDFTVWGIAIGAGGRNEIQAEPLRTLCDGKVATVKTLVNSQDIRDVFRGL